MAGVFICDLIEGGECMADDQGLAIALSTKIMTIEALASKTAPPLQEMHANLPVHQVDITFIINSQSEKYYRARIRCRS